jgi:hypothetical protein
MNQQSHKLYRIVCIICIGIAVLWFGWSIYRATVFRVASVAPAPSKISMLTPYVNIIFSHDIDKHRTILPKADFINSASIDHRTMTIRLGNIRIGQKYTLTIPSVSDTSGKLLTNLTYTFTPAEGNWDKLSEKEQKAIMSDQQAQKPATITDPVLQYVPYATLDYRIDPIAKGDMLTLHIQLLLPPNTPTADEPGIIEHYRNEALGYISSRNIDASKYHLEYEVIRETLNGH